MPVDGGPHRPVVARSDARVGQPGGQPVAAPGTGRAPRHRLPLGLLGARHAPRGLAPLDTDLEACIHPAKVAAVQGGELGAAGREHESDAEQCGVAQPTGALEVYLHPSRDTVKRLTAEHDALNRSSR